MNVSIFGRNIAEIEPAVKAAGFRLVSKTPDLVISYGGDGTLMKAEAAYPGIPKVLLKNSQICKKCSILSNEEVLRKVYAGDYTTEELFKLTLQAVGTTLEAINDVSIHNADARHAIRYSLTVNGQAVGDAIIGDGVVIATPFGSTGYYRSITDSFFEVGIGLAFNNSTEQSDHMVLRDGSRITLTILRGPAVAYADNQDHSIPLSEGDIVTVSKSSHTARIVIPKLG